MSSLRDQAFAQYTDNPMYLFRFEIPISQPLIFEDIFYQVQDETIATFKSISDTRNQLVIASSRSFTNAAVDGIARYLPLLYGLKKSIDQFPPDFSKYFKTSWTSPLSSNDKKSYTNSNFYFEVVSVMNLYALLHRKLAYEVHDDMNYDNFDEVSKISLRYLMEAAGLFEYLAGEAANNFIVSCNNLPIPEVFSDSFLLQSCLCYGEGQQYIVRKAIMKETNGEIIAQLCLGIVRSFQEALEYYTRIKEGGKKNFINTDLKDYIDLTIAMYTSLSYKYMGLSEYTKGEPGIAVGCLGIAYEQAKDINFSNHQNHVVQELFNMFNTERTSLQRLYLSYKSDNESIYHESIPSQITLPEPRMIVKPIQFTPPTPQHIEILEKENTSLCSIQ